MPGGNSGFAANGADITVTLQNGGTPVLWGGTTFNPGVLVINTATSANTVSLAADLDLNGAARFIAVNGGAANVSGIISGATGALRVDGAGLLLVPNTNTFGGGTIIDAGPQGAATVRATANGALGTGGVTIAEGGNASTGRLELAGGITLPNAIGFNGRNNDSVAIQNISGNNTLSGKLTASPGGNRYWIQSDAGTLTLSGADAAAAGVAFTAASGRATSPSAARAMASSAAKFKTAAGRFRLPRKAAAPGRSAAPRPTPARRPLPSARSASPPI
jgi:autotransporter-associated beta strand protein